MRKYNHPSGGSPLVVGLVIQYLPSYLEGVSSIRNLRHVIYGDRFPRNVRDVNLLEENVNGLVTDNTTKIIAGRQKLLKFSAYCLI
jgi:hypothetical protein